MNGLEDSCFVWGLTKVRGCFRGWRQASIGFMAEKCRGCGMPASHGFFRRIAPQNDGWIEVVLFQRLSASLRMDSAGGRVLLSHPDFARMRHPFSCHCLRTAGPSASLGMTILP